MDVHVPVEKHGSQLASILLLRPIPPEVRSLALYKTGSKKTGIHLKGQLVSVHSRDEWGCHDPGVVHDGRHRLAPDRILCEGPHRGEGRQVEGTALHARVRVLSDDVGHSFVASSHVSVWIQCTT